MVKFRKKTRRKFKKKGGTRYLCSQVRKAPTWRRSPDKRPQASPPPRRFSTWSSHEQTQLVSPRRRVEGVKGPTQDPRPPASPPRRHRKRPSRPELEGFIDPGIAVATDFNPPKRQQSPPLGASGSTEMAEYQQENMEGVLRAANSTRPDESKKKGNAETRKGEQTVGPIKKQRSFDASSSEEEMGGGSKKRKRRKQKKTRKARGIIDDLRELCTTGRCGSPRPQRPTLRQVAFTIEQNILRDLNKNKSKKALTDKELRNIKAVANYEAARIINNSRSASKKKKKKRR